MSARRSSMINPHCECTPTLASTVAVPCSYLTMEWNDDVTYALTPLKLISAPLGFWPLQENNMFDLLRYSLASGSMVWVLVSLCFEIYYNCINSYAKIDMLLIFTCGLLALLKITWFRIYADNLISNFNSAIEDYHAVDNDEKRAVMRRHAFMGRMICYCVAYYETKYPVPSTCTLGSLPISTTFHIVIYVMQAIVLVIISSGNLGGDSFYLAITLHVCGQVEILRDEFANFGMKSSNPKEDFSKLVTRHHYLLHQAMLLADTISFILVMQLLISCILICII
ncbi:PREDICTED: uncharacterized protein LOC106747836, partial [Dinoponera quadriceps]|uniref:Uncharacterized protein LOC106747836 n=1 Tax=Dinoponera quadriceps TaxID=609295 RepID=A0A6P3XRW4_DINQU